MSHYAKPAAISLLLGIVLASLLGFVREDCHDKKPDPDSIAFCGKGENNPCSSITDQQTCEGAKRKNRAVVASKCVANPDTCCFQVEVHCWTEYSCDWNSSANACEENEALQSATSFKKTQTGCVGEQDPKTCGTPVQP